MAIPNSDRHAGWPILQRQRSRSRRFSGPTHTLSTSVGRSLSVHLCRAGREFPYILGGWRVIHTIPCPTTETTLYVTSYFKIYISTRIEEASPTIDIYARRKDNKKSLPLIRERLCGPRGSRIPVSGLRGQRPRPLDDGASTAVIVTDSTLLSSCCSMKRELCGISFDTSPAPRIISCVSHNIKCVLDT